MKFTVTHDDPGIRPAGPKNACFYCRAFVGQHHADDCVIVEVDVTYDVLIGEELVGQYKTTEPASWDEGRGDFHKNCGTWCKDNMLDDPGLEVGVSERERLEEISITAGCLCGGVVRLRQKERGTEARKCGK